MDHGAALAGTSWRPGCKDFKLCKVVLLLKKKDTHHTYVKETKLWIKICDSLG